jgi:hypothetical protein
VNEVKGLVTEVKAALVRMAPEAVRLSGSDSLQ